MGGSQYVVLRVLKVLRVLRVLRVPVLTVLTVLRVLGAGANGGGTEAAPFAVSALLAPPPLAP